MLIFSFLEGGHMNTLCYLCRDYKQICLILSGPKNEGVCMMQRCTCLKLKIRDLLCTPCKKIYKVNGKESFFWAFTKSFIHQIASHLKIIRYFKSFYHFKYILLICYAKFNRQLI